MANKNTRSVKIYGMSGYKYQATMRSMAGIDLRRRDMVVHGRGSVTSMLRSIRSVSCVLNVELSCRLKRSITSCL